MSFIFQNFKGIIYLILVVSLSVFRSISYRNDNSSSPQNIDDKSICSTVRYSTGGNATFSVFYIAFSLVYICGPMFINNEINFFIFSAFLFYFLLDIGIRYYTGCIKNKAYILLDTIIGVLSGILVLYGMYSMNIQKYLFFNETSSNKQVCSLPKKQTFKCSVYKNGELVGSSVN